MMGLSRPMSRSRSSALALVPPALVLGLGPALAGQEADLAEKMFRSGERAYAAKSYAEAFETWNQLIKAAAGSDYAAMAQLRMARHQWEVERKPEAALAILDRVKAEHLKDGYAAEAMLMRGSLLAAQARKPADLREPVAEFNRVLDLYPDHPAVAETRFQLGMAWKDQGNPRKALAEFVEAAVTQLIGRPANLDAHTVDKLAAASRAAIDLFGESPALLDLEQEAGLREVHPRTRHGAAAGVAVLAERDRRVAALGLQAPQRHREVAEHVVGEEPVGCGAGLEEAHELVGEASARLAVGEAGDGLVVGHVGPPGSLVIREA